MLCLLAESEHVDAVITQAAADGANCPGRRAKSPRSMGSHLCTTEDTHSVPMTSFKRQMGRPATRETGNNRPPSPGPLHPTDRHRAAAPPARLRPTSVTVPGLHWVTTVRLPSD